MHNTVQRKDPAVDISDSGAAKSKPKPIRAIPAEQFLKIKNKYEK
jgi:hypothetical protein